LLGSEQSRDGHKRELVAPAYLCEVFESMHLATSSSNVNGDMTEVQEERKVTAGFEQFLGLLMDYLHRVEGHSLATRSLS